MSLRFYMDEHVKRAVTNGLRVRGLDVLTTQDDGHAGQPDHRILDRATELGRVLFTQDDDFLVEAKARQDEGTSFSGVVYAYQLRATIGECVLDLELIAQATDDEEIRDQVIYLPL